MSIGGGVCMFLHVDPGEYVCVCVWRSICPDMYVHTEVVVDDN